MMFCLLTLLPRELLTTHVIIGHVFLYMLHSSHWYGISESNSFQTWHYYLGLLFLHDLHKEIVFQN